MKKIICMTLALVMIAFCAVGCGKNADKDIDLSAVMTDIKKQVTSIPADMMDIAQDDLIKNYYGIEKADYESYAASINTTGIDVTEIAMFKASSDDAVKNIEEKLQARKSSQENQMQNYLPEQYKIVKNSSVVTNGKYVTLFVGTDSAKMTEIFNSYLE